jgi:hypothetical protein
LIQKDYTNKSFFEYYYRKDLESRNPLDVKMTDSGRTAARHHARRKFTSRSIRSFSAAGAPLCFFNFSANYLAPIPRRPQELGTGRNVLHDFRRFRSTTS